MSDIVYLDWRRKQILKAYESMLKWRIRHIADFMIDGKEMNKMADNLKILYK